jgi:hypothetical protein
LKDLQGGAQGDGQGHAQDKDLAGGRYVSSGGAAGGGPAGGPPEWIPSAHGPMAALMEPLPLIDAIPPIRGLRGRPKQRPRTVFADRIHQAMISIACSITCLRRPLNSF